MCACPSPLRFCAGWAAIRRLSWMPVGGDRVTFRTDVLKATLRAKGNPTAVDRIMRKAVAALPMHQFWKKGSITVIVDSISRPLFFLSLFVIVIGAVILGVGASGMRKSSLAAFPVTVIGIFLTSLGLLGTFGARKRAQVASCLVLSHFYMTLTLVVLLGIAILWWFAFPTSSDALVAKNWSSVNMLYPGITYTANANSTEKVHEFRLLLNAGSNVYSLATSLFIVLAVRARADMCAA